MFVIHFIYMTYVYLGIREIGFVFSNQAFLVDRSFRWKRTIFQLVAFAAGGRDEETYRGTPKAYSKNNFRTAGRKSIFVACRSSLKAYGLGFGSHFNSFGFIIYFFEGVSYQKSTFPLIEWACAIGAKKILDSWCSILITPEKKRSKKFWKISIFVSGLLLIWLKCGDELTAQLVRFIKPCLLKNC